MENQILKNIAKRKIKLLVEAGNDTNILLIKFVIGYDKAHKTIGTDRLLFQYLLNELGYELKSGAWIKI